MKKINIGFIGCGEIAQIMHLPYVHESDKFNIHSLCNSSITPLKFVAERYNVPLSRCYSDYNDLIKDDNLDAVAICTHDHFDPAIKAAQAGKHIFVEKPLAFNVYQAKGILDAVEKNNVILQVGYMKPFDPGFEYFLKKFNKINEISHFRMHNFSGDYSFIPKIYDLCDVREISNKTKKMREKLQDRAVIDEIGDVPEYLKRAYMNMLLGTTHDSVLLRILFGNDIQVKSSNIFEDGLILAYLVANEQIISWESHFIVDRMHWDENMYVYSPECEMSLHFPSPYLKNAVSKVLIKKNDNDGKNKNIEVIASYDESYRREWQHFYDCILYHKSPLTDGYGALCDIKIASDIIKKSKKQLK